MLVAAEIDAVDERPVVDVDTFVQVRLPECVFEPAPIELVRGRRREGVRAPLVAARNVRVAVSREEVPEAGLLELLVFEVVPHPDDLGEVVGADLDGGLADLEGGVRRRALALLRDEHRGLGTGPLQLTTQAEAGQPPSEDDDVVARSRPVACAAKSGVLLHVFALLRSVPGEYSNGAAPNVQRQPPLFGLATV